jgi:hypothetical protein
MAGTITGVLSRIGVRQGSPQICKLVLTCTGDAATGSYPATILNPLAVDIDGSLFDIRGLKIYSVKAYPGGTAPTDATDATITDEYGIDLLGGKGTDLVDATSKTWIMAGPVDSYMPPLITGNITLTITNNSVASAVTTIILELVGD